MTSLSTSTSTGWEEGDEEWLPVGLVFLLGGSKSILKLDYDDGYILCEYTKNH